MTKKSKDLLVDTVVVIDAHEKGYWERLCNAYRIFLPGTVADDELFFFTSEKGKRPFLVSNWIEQGKVSRIDAELIDFANLTKRLANDFMLALDAGELEALAILTSKKHQHLMFTTADKAAIKALGVLSLGMRGVSVEDLLNSLQGISQKMQRLERHFTKAWFQKALTEGFTEQHLWLKPL
jgi:hypothetical protein